MLTPDLCTEEEVCGLAHAFHERVREDDTLGPIFDRQVRDLAGRIAGSLWHGCQLGRRADPLPGAA